MGSFTPNSLYEFTGICAFIIMTAAAFFSMRRNPRLQDEFVSKSEYEKQQAEIKSELARHSASRKSIYEKLEVNGRSVERIEATLESNKQAMDDLKKGQASTMDELKETNSRIDRVDERLDAIPERVIRSLKEAKGLI